MPYLGVTSKMIRMISVCFQGKPFNITVIQLDTPTTDADKGEIEQIHEYLKTLYN